MSNTTFYTLFFKTAKANIRFSQIIKMGELKIFKTFDILSFFAAR